MRITKIAMHEGPHVDEIAALLILKRWGEYFFSVVRSTEVVYWSQGGATPDGESAESWLKQGVLCLGQGFGQFDEHPNLTRGIPRKTNECTTSLVAKALGFKKGNETPISRAVRHLVSLVTDLDLKGGSDLLSVEQTLSAMSRRGVSSAEMLDWGIKGIAAILDDQIEFQKEFDNARGRNYRYYTIGPVILAVVESDSEYACKAARVGGRANLVIRCNPDTGHITIMRDMKQVPTALMEEIVVKLRRLEKIDADKIRISLARRTEAAAEGHLYGWYYHPRFGLVTTGGNRGSRSAQPSQTSFNKIVETIVSVLEDLQTTTIFPMRSSIAHI